MSKSTKIIAGLGVAAALGVAALPVASFAYTGTGTVAVSAEITGTIGMQINTLADGMMSGDIADTTTQAGFEADFGAVTLGYGYKKAGNTIIKVHTNQPGGYVLSATGADLAQTGAGAGTAVIPASTAGVTVATNAAAVPGAVSGWGITVDKTHTGTATTETLGSFFGAAAGDVFKADTSSQTIDTVSDVLTSYEGTYTIGYGLTIADNQPSGAYSGTITYVATNE